MRLTQLYAIAIIVLQVPVAFAQMKDIIPVNVPADVKVAYPIWSVATPAWAVRCFRDSKGAGRDAYYGQVYDRESKLLTASARLKDVPEGMRMLELLVWKGRLFRVYEKLDKSNEEVEAFLQEMELNTLSDIGELRPMGRIRADIRGHIGYHGSATKSNHDGSFLAYVSFFQDDDGYGNIMASVVDKELKPVWSKASSIPLKAWKFLRSEVKIDGRGNVLFSVLELAHAVDYTLHSDSRVAHVCSS